HSNIAGSGSGKRHADASINTASLEASISVEVQTEDYLVTNSKSPDPTTIIGVDKLLRTPYSVANNAGNPELCPMVDFHSFCLCCYDFPVKPYTALEWPTTHDVNFELALKFRNSFFSLVSEAAENLPRSGTGLESPEASIVTHEVLPSLLGHGRCFCCYSAEYVHLDPLSWPPKSTRAVAYNQNDSDSESMQSNGTNSSMTSNRSEHDESSERDRAEQPQAEVSKIVAGNNIASTQGLHKPSSGTARDLPLADTDRSWDPVLSKLFSNLTGSTDSVTSERSIVVSRSPCINYTTAECIDPRRPRLASSASTDKDIPRVVFDANRFMDERASK
ncbi:unnamed protein product, partial [Allacma fusca]